MPARPDRPSRSARVSTPTCGDCFFRRHMLCALDRDTACATFRPDHEDGLKPPRQMRMALRPERTTGAPFAFPSAQEQAQRYAA